MLEYSTNWLSMLLPCFLWWTSGVFKPLEFPHLSFRVFYLSLFAIQAGKGEMCFGGEVS